MAVSNSLDVGQRRAAGIAGAKGGLAHVHRHRGDLARACRLHRETFPIIRDLGDRQDAAEWLKAMAALDVTEPVTAPSMEAAEFPT